VAPTEPAGALVSDERDGLRFGVLRPLPAEMGIGVPAGCERVVLANVLMKAGFGRYGTGAANETSRPGGSPDKCPP
jgi:hypothetical protein